MMMTYIMRLIIMIGLDRLVNQHLLTKCGLVFIDLVYIYNARLAFKQLTALTSNCEGLAVTLRGKVMSILQHDYHTMITILNCGDSSRFREYF